MAGEGSRSIFFLPRFSPRYSINTAHIGRRLSCAPHVLDVQTRKVCEKSTPRYYNPIGACLFGRSHMSQQGLICVFKQGDFDNRTLIGKYDSREPVDVILQHLRTLGFVDVESLRSYKDPEFYGKEGNIPAGDYVIVNSSSSNLSGKRKIIFHKIINILILNLFIIADEVPSPQKRSLENAEEQLPPTKKSSRASWTPELLTRLKLAIPKYPSANGRYVDWTRVKTEEFNDIPLTVGQIQSRWRL